MNIVDMSYGTRRTVLTKTLVTQLVDICGDMWRVITRANSSHIVVKLVTVGQGLKYVQNTCTKNRISWVLLAEFMLTSLTLFCIMYCAFF